MENSEEQLLAGRYVLGAILGQGGMGIVRKALDLKMQREVAIKLLSAPSPNFEAARRFSDEALAAGSLQHANVVRVFDVGEEDGRPFLVTELLEGETLQRRLKRGPIPLEQAQSWARQLAEGLIAAHEKGLIHRDLKPSNLFITSDGWLKILDFGLATLSAADAGRVVGTIGYMAPEQVRGLPADHRADLFNFGLVMYEMLAGQRAFADFSATETSYAIVVRETARLPASVPPSLRRLIERCLSKDRNDRPASAQELLRLLQSPAPSKRRWLPALALLLIPLAILVRRYAIDGPPPVGIVSLPPFDGHESPRLAALGDGVAELLSIDLKEAQLRSVITPAPLRATVKLDEVGSLDRARTAALRDHAKYFVFGSLHERKGELVADATLRESESGKVVVSAEVKDKPENFVRLVRHLSDRLQRRPLPQAEFEARVALLQRERTASFPALQAWFEAERAWIVSDVRTRIDKLREAVRIDPDFARANFMLGLMDVQENLDLAEAEFAEALRQSDKLSETQRVRAKQFLLRLQGESQQAEQLLANAIHEHPENTALLNFMGEMANDVTLYGRSPQEAERWFQKVTNIEPDNRWALHHLIVLAMLRGERDVVATLADRLLSVTDGDAAKGYYGLARAWARGDRAGHDELMKNLLAKKKDVGAIGSAMSVLEVMMDGSLEVETLGDVLPPDPNWQLARGMGSLALGRVRNARRTLGAIHSGSPVLFKNEGGDTAYYIPWIDTLSFLSVTPAQLATSRAAAARVDVTDEPTRGPGKQYLIGRLALRAHDLKAAEAAVAALQATPELPKSSIVADLVLDLRAHLLFAKGDVAGALAALEAQKIRIPDRLGEFYNHDEQNFFRGSLLVQAGRLREALPFYETGNDSGNDIVFYAPGNLYVGRIYDSLGDKDRAIFHYERFVSMWSNADPEQRAEVDRARARLLQLQSH